MLSSKNRVNKELFKEIMEKGRSVHSPIVSLSFLKSQKETEKRFTAAIPKKSYPKAVDRNLLKRRVRSILKKNLKTLPSILGVVFLKKGAKEIPFRELEKTIMEVFQKIR